MSRIFILGGNDGEMALIKQLLSMAGEKWVQPNAGWGEHVYTPQDVGVDMETYDACPEGAKYGHPDPKLRAKSDDWPNERRVVFVECHPSPEGWGTTPIEVVDHHGSLAWKPASVLQVVTMLSAHSGQLKKTHAGSDKGEGFNLSFQGFRVSESTLRWVELVAANDAGYIPAMEALGVTREEIHRVRALDRSAQGITSEQEKIAIEAIENKEVLGRLTVVRLEHSKCAPVTDRLYGAVDQLVIFSTDEEGEVNFFGDGKLCATLKDKFQGWNGGSGLGKKGANAYWGGTPADQNAVLAFLQDELK